MTSAPVAPTRFAPDPSLPQRDTLLDDGAMAAVFQRALGQPVSACRRRRAKYRVGDSLRVCYEVEVEVEGGSAGEGEVRLIAIRAFSPDHGHRAEPRSGPEPDLDLADLGALGWIFPNDRKLTALRRLWSSPSLRHQLVGDGGSLDLVAYAPEKGATIRGVSAQGTTLGYTKLYTGQGHQLAARKHRLLGPALLDRGIAAPRVRATNEALGALEVTPVPGRLLADTTSPDHWWRLGHATAELHATPLASELPPFERATLPRLQSAGTLIPACRPDVGGGVARLLERLVDGAPAAAEAGDQVVLHGDLHGKNVLVDEERIGFIDLDQAARGPAGAELGSAIATLRHDTAGTARERRAGHRLEVAFLAGYQRRRPVPPPAVLSWYVAAALLGERALRAVNRVRPDGLDRLGATIGLALDALAEGGR